jgi:hypothetical protein
MMSAPMTTLFAWLSYPCLPPTNGHPSFLETPLAVNFLETRLERTAQGYGSQEPAAQILVSVTTVETYRARII